MTQIAQSGRGSPRVPDWLDNLAGLGWRLLVSLALGVVLFLLAVRLSMVTATLIVATCIVAAFAPLVIQRRNRGWSRSKAAAVGSLVAMLVVVAGIVFVALAFIPYVPGVVQAIEAGLAALHAQLSGVSGSEEAVNAVDAVVGAAVSWFLSTLGAIIGDIATVVTVLILAGFLTFYLLLDGDKGWSTALRAGRDWQRERLTEGGKEALERLGGFLRGTALLAVCDAVGILVVLLVLGVPLAGPLAVIVLFGGFVPYVGVAVTTIILFLVALATVGLTSAVLLLLAVVAINVVVDRIIIPRLLGRRIQVHPAVALVAIPVGAAIAGLFGLFFAVPIVVLVMSLTDSLIAVLGTRRPAPEIDGIVPVWLDRIAQWSWRLLVLLALMAAVIAIIGQASFIVLPLIFAAVLAPTFQPVVRYLEVRGLRRWPASFVVVIGATVASAVLLWLTFASLVGAAASIVEQASAGAGDVDGALGGVAAVLQPIVASIGGEIRGVIGFVLASAAVGVLLVAAISLVLSFFLLLDGARGWAFATRRLSPWRRTALDGAAERSVGVLGGYMFGTAVISAFGAATQWALMTILGLPLALPLAILSFFGGFIPYIGGFITTGLAFLVTFAVGTPFDIAVMGVFTIVFNIVQGNVLQPLVYGRTASLHPAIVLLAIPAGGALAGILGMFLVVPVLGIISVTWRTVLITFGDEAEEAEAAARATASAGGADAAARGGRTVDPVSTPPTAMKPGAEA